MAVNCYQRTCHFSTIADNSEASGWDCIRLGLQSDIEVKHNFTHFDLGMTSCDLCMTFSLLRVASAGRLFGLELQTLWGKVLSDPALEHSFIFLHLTFALCPGATIAAFDVA